MKKVRHLLASFFIVVILLVQLASLFHVFEHLHENHTDEISLVEKNNFHSISSIQNCLLCDFFLSADVALLPSFIAIIFTSLLLSSSEITHILKKRIFYILNKKSRAPPYGV